MKKNNTPTASPDSQDEVFFENYLQGNSPLSDLYQKADSPEPSDELNQKILSAARISAEKAPPPLKTHWWAKPGSWAASAVIFSLAGILAHNTWQAEQDALEKDLLPEQSLSKKSIPSDYSMPSESKVSTESEFQTSSSGRPLAQAKKRIPQEEKNDSRKLLYKSTPAPVMQAAPKYMTRSQIGSVADMTETEVLKMENAGDKIQSLPELEMQVDEKEQSANRLNQEQEQEQQLWLKKISQLIANEKFAEAQQLLLQFKIKYPDYPIDPVILQHLSPY